LFKLGLVRASQAGRHAVTQTDRLMHACLQSCSVVGILWRDAYVCSALCIFMCMLCAVTMHMYVLLCYDEHVCSALFRCMCMLCSVLMRVYALLCSHACVCSALFRCKCKLCSVRIHALFRCMCMLCSLRMHALFQCMCVPMAPLCSLKNQQALSTVFLLQ
jgi:hypothetical protein